MPLFWYGERMDSKGRHQCTHWCNKQSGGLFVSPWESPSDSRRIRYGCGWEPNRAIKRISRYPFGYLLFGLSGGTRRSRSNSPVDCWAMGRGPSLPYDVPSGNIGNESLPAYAKRSLAIVSFSRGRVHRLPYASGVDMHRIRIDLIRRTPSGAWQTDTAHQKSRYCSQTETWTYCGLSV